jgi:hypothetical protein
VIGCDSFATGAYLNGSIEHGFDTVEVSDDPLEDEDNPRFWFQVDANRDPPSSYPIAGNGLATGTNQDGAPCDVRISIEELRSRITFTQRKFRGYETFTGDVASARGADFFVAVKAPLIDGSQG